MTPVDINVPSENGLPAFRCRGKAIAFANYNDAALGWNFTVIDHGQASEIDSVKKIHIYDTTLPSMSNGGHTFGDVLLEEQRSEVIEYLKTL